ncbi:methyltransferase [Aeromonas veronii]|uniref:methyltransferase n=1 Tax=Aeromonas veronii TaxID=654 RepID=UPI00244535F1|nr:methyltransferase [Aeromonas veronii]
MNHYQADRHNALDAISQAQRIAFAPMLFQAAWSLREFGILAFLAKERQGATAAQIAEATGLTEYAVSVLLDMGLGGGICHLNGECYLLDKVGHYLLSDPMTRVNMDFVQHVCYKPLAHLQQAIESGTPAGLKEFGDWSNLYAHLKELPEPARSSWFRFDHFYSDWAFKQAQDLVFGYEPRHLYDLGGNTGKWAISCARRSPELQVTILDLPEQIAMAREQIVAEGLAERVQGYPVNLLSEQALPAEADIWWMSQFLDCFSHDEIVAMLRRIRSSMKEGGQVVHSGAVLGSAAVRGSELQPQRHLSLLYLSGQW